MIRFSYRLQLRGLLQIAVGSLLKHRLRSLLSVVGIICGVSAVFAILSIGEGAKREVMDGIRRLGLENIIIRRIPTARESSAARDWSNGLQLADVSLLREASPFISGVASLRDLRATVSGLNREVTPQIVACSSSYLPLLGLTPLRGRFIMKRDVKRQNLICVLGDSLAHRLGPQGKIGSRIRIDDQLFLVVGIVRSSSAAAPKKNGTVMVREINEMLFIPLGSHLYLSRESAPGPMQDLDEVIVKVRSQDKVEAVLPLIRRSLDLRHQGVRDYQLIVPRQLMLQAGKTQRVFNLVLGAIGGISLVVGGIGIMNVLLATVSERTREIGIRRAVGAARGDIIAQFLAEAVLLTTTGGIAGIGVGFLCSWLIARFAGWAVAVTTYGIVVPLLTSVAVGICFGIYPALKAADMDPVHALRSA